MPAEPNLFLSAEWVYLVMLNYIVEPALLLPYLPSGTALDSFDGKTYITLVGFLFRKTKMFGKISVPLHSEFEEVNLRFYVRHGHETEQRRGVVFIKEIVPKPAIAFTARFVYGENYVSLPMKHSIAAGQDGVEVEYAWKYRGRWSRLTATASGVPHLPAQNSIEQYITEHYWGYTRRSASETLEYRVSHVPWRLWPSAQAFFEGDGRELYGEKFGSILVRNPDSAFIAEGSPVSVLRGIEIT